MWQPAKMDWWNLAVFWFTHGFGSSFFVTKHDQVTHFLTELSDDGASTFLGQHFDLVDHTLR